MMKDEDRGENEAEVDDTEGEPHDYLQLIGDDEVPPETSAAVEDQSEVDVGSDGNNVAEEYSMLGATGQAGGDAQNFPEHPYTILTEVFRYVENNAITKLNTFIKSLHCYACKKYVE
jgi:hypothetical protein